MGTYDVKLEYKDREQWERGVEIKPAQTTEKKITFGISEGDLLVIVRKADGSPEEDIYIKIYRAGEEEEEVASNWAWEEGAEFELQVGTYDVKLEYKDREQWERGVEIKPAQTTEKKITFNISEGNLVVIVRDQNGDPFEDAYITLYKAGTEEEIASDWAWGEGAEFEIEVGRYDVKIVYEDGGIEKWIKDVEIKPAQTTEKKVILYIKE